MLELVCRQHIRLAEEETLHHIYRIYTDPVWFEIGSRMVTYSLILKLVMCRVTMRLMH